MIADWLAGVAFDTGFDARTVFLASGLRFLISTRLRGLSMMSSVPRKMILRP